MASRDITFDVNAGTPFNSNITINGGSDFSNTFVVTRPNGTAYNFEGYTGSSSMSKSVSIGATLGITTSFNVGFTSAAGGRVQISLGSTDTRNLKEGRYVYDVLVSSGSTIYRIVEGNVIVKPVVSAAP